MRVLYGASETQANDDILCVDDDEVDEKKRRSDTWG